MTLFEKSDAGDLAALARRARAYAGKRQQTAGIAALIAKHDETKRAFDGVDELIIEANDLIFISDLLMELAESKKGETS